jgi:low temperature requirement protein LtrA
VEAATGTRNPRLTPAWREEERVTPLELFFDLVFVLALTQCTALMAANPTWEGLAQGLLVLGVLWWAWVGYAWLTSVVNPEQGLVRISMFAAMAAFLVVSLCIPRAFGSEATLFACAYGVVRLAQIALFMLASRDTPDLRHSVVGLAVSTAIGVGILLAAATQDGVAQGAIWAFALALDMGGPLLFGVEGWKLVPEHFAERHGLIIIIALGESIVAIGAGASGVVTTGVVIAAILGIAIASVLWWLYFDVVATVAGRRLGRAVVGRDQNAMARDSYSFLHLPMVAGIVLSALGFKKTLGHVDEPLKIVSATAMMGGVALYLLAHVAFRYRHIHSINTQRLVTSAVLLALIPLAPEISALAMLAIVAVILAALVAVESAVHRRYRARSATS